MPFDEESDIIDTLKSSTNYLVKLQLGQKYVSEQNVKYVIKSISEKHFTDNSLTFALIHSLV